MWTLGVRQAGRGVAWRAACPASASSFARAVSTQPAMQAIARDGFAVTSLGASASVQDMEAVAMKLMRIDGDGAGKYNGMGGVSRKSIDGTGFVDSAAGAPSEVTIQFHHEMAYAAAYPKYVTFAMVRQAEEDGTTLLADSVKVQELMSESLLGKFRSLGVQYIRHLHDASEEGAPDFYTSWQGAFLTEDIGEAMRKGNSPSAFSILARRDARRLRQTVWCPVFHQHPEHGELFFNSVLNRHGSWLDGHSYWGKAPNGERPYHCVWGDGAELSADELSEIREVHQKSTISLKLDPGDVLVVDNLRVAHGRTPYRGDRLLGLLLSDMTARAPCQPPAAFAARLDLEGAAA